MIKHLLLIAVLEEMVRLASKVRQVGDLRHEGWEEDYGSYRRQLGLCLTEMVKLAQDDLEMRAEDAQVLQTTFEACRARIARHQVQFPLEAIVFDDPAYITSLNQVDAGFQDFKAMMLDLVERYEVEAELVT
ncbi:hypothetical protein IP81_03390 [Novosphingobium sp. AAP83]|uniref:hypothetical protein n=1 Tax=Novosphingobium sp. AAP83 TaxID=1523425 RepID=UPI0006B97DC1|nr:hypothetical protein [Novosphingobium sp. AAP83]KPF93285.1 hypothetical protein IP81_03390 [Novosphingobium sp. AAP83]